MFGSKVEILSTIPKKAIFQETNKENWWDGHQALKKFNLVDLLCPDRCIPFFSSSFLPECPPPGQNNLMKQLQYKRTPNINNDSNNNNNKNISY